MQDERSIRLRFKDEVFQKLDRKRFEDRTTFQEVGERLLLRWLSGAEPPASPFEKLTEEETQLLRAVLRYWREMPETDMHRQTLAIMSKRWAPKSP